MFYLVTNRKLTGGRSLPEVVRQAALGGVKWIILREKDLPEKELYQLAAEIKTYLDPVGAKLIINGSLAIAKRLDCAGYHSEYQQFLDTRPRFSGLIGVSVHSVPEAVTAEKCGADYLLAGHIYQTDSKKGVAPRGISFISEVKANVTIPVVAIGGITPTNVEEVLTAGADGVAVMSYIMQASDARNAALTLAQKAMTIGRN